MQVSSSVLSFVVPRIAFPHLLSSGIAVAAAADAAVHLPPSKCVAGGQVPGQEGRGPGQAAQQPQPTGSRLVAVTDRDDLVESQAQLRDGTRLGFALAANN